MWWSVWGSSVMCSVSWDAGGGSAWLRETACTGADEDGAGVEDDWDLLCWNCMG